MTVSDAARKIGVLPSVYSRWESGDRFPDDASWTLIWSAMRLARKRGAVRVVSEEGEAMRTAQRKIYDARHATPRRKGR